MKYVVTRTDFSHVKAEVEGYYPVKGSFEDFFNELNSYIGRKCFVNDVKYKNHSIFIEKLDPDYGYLYTDEYVLDGLLESDARFMEQLASFLAKFDRLKDRRQGEVAEKMEKRATDMKVVNTASKIYTKYCAEGEIELIDDYDIARRVVKMFENENPLVYTGLTCTMEGDPYTFPRYKFSTPLINRLKVATGVSAAATGALAVSFFTVGSPVSVAAAIATGACCYISNQKRKKENDEEAKRKVHELADIYGKMYPELPDDKDKEKVFVK